MDIAVVGSGISGLAAAHRLKNHARVTLYEAGHYLGGHTNTVDVCLPDAHGKDVSHGVDTGFLVFNHRTYPGLVSLLEELEVATARSDMSFSVQVPQGSSAGKRMLEWSGTNLTTVFAQRSNLLRPKFWHMLQDLLRFNRLCTRIAEANEETALMQPLGEFLTAQGFEAAFREWYLLPMLGSIWSCPTDQMLRFPVVTVIRFCHNHGLIQVKDRPQWSTVAGGARNYVRKLAAGLDARLSTPVTRIDRDAHGVCIYSDGNAERFDAVVLAVHSDQALQILAQPSAQEASVLGRIRYRPNRAVLHTDVSMLPTRRSAWAAWNYERASDATQESAGVCLHYWLNRLQPLPFRDPVVVSLNPLRDIAAERILAEFQYQHPVFDLPAIRAQAQIQDLQGQHHTWFCGAWTGYGFHEDGLQSGYAAADSVLSGTHRRGAA